MIYIVKPVYRSLLFISGNNLIAATGLSGKPAY